VNKSTNEETKPGGLNTLISRFIAYCDAIPHWLLAVIARASVASVFWRSGRTKVDGFSIKDSTFALFETEYALPLIPPELAAYMATIAEHVFPILLVVGLASRFSAIALLGMTSVIQVLVYPSAWPVHIFWVMGLVYVIARGPGPLALDHLIARRFS
jgi:putative oxidoreductase